MPGELEIFRVEDLHAARLDLDINFRHLPLSLLQWIMVMINKRKTAVVLYDIQNVTMKRRDNLAHRKAIEESGLVPNLVRLVTGVRPHRIPIMWIHTERRADRADVFQNLVDEGGWTVPDEWSSALIDEMVVAPEDHMIGKLRRDPFIGTNLDLQLRARTIDTILLGGYATNWGVESTARTAYDLGYHVVLLSDCCSTCRSRNTGSLSRTLCPGFPE